MNKEIREFQAKKGIDIESMIFRLMKEYANKRVIDELEKFSNYTDEDVPFVWRDRIKDRIKELKQ